MAKRRYTKLTVEQRQELINLMEETKKLFIEKAEAYGKLNEHTLEELKNYEIKTESNIQYLEEMKAPYATYDFFKTWVIKNTINRMRWIQ